MIKKPTLPYFLSHENPVVIIAKYTIIFVIKQIKGGETQLKLPIQHMVPVTIVEAFSGIYYSALVRFDTFSELKLSKSETAPAMHLY